MQHLCTSENGITRTWRDNHDGTVSIIASQDLEAVLDFCKAAQTHNDGYTPSREMRRIFFLPDIVAIQWLNEEGWWAYDPACRDKLAAKMNDPDYAHLKTSPGQIGFRKRMH